MTRFARASGSKGSNEKQPEDATSWLELKEAMLRKQDGNLKFEPLTKPVTDTANVPSVEEIQTVWADLVGKSTKEKKMKTKKSSFGSGQIIQKEVINETSSEVLEEKAIVKKRGKKTKDKIGDDVEQNSKKRVKQCLNTLDVIDDCLQPQTLNGGKNKKSKKQVLDACVETQTVLKKKKKKGAVNLETIEGDIDIKSSSKKQKRKFDDQNILSTKNKKIKKTINELAPTEVVENNTTDVPSIHTNKVRNQGDGVPPSTPNNSPTKKVQIPREKKRRKAELQSSQVMINGRPVEVCPFDGFMVQSDDAVRLRELRKSMIAKGIPYAEREAAIKLERRRAEKALARLKKQVCFHCRQSGHNLSECPQIAEDQRSSGICYKCGSTEHTHFQCRVTRGDDFRFAECFICKEQGHIAKQCPDNPRGLYPRGGACAACGDVTHLKKDCPKYLAEKEDVAVTAEKRNDRVLEALDEDLPVMSAPKVSKKTNKHIKF